MAIINHPLLGTINCRYYRNSHSIKAYWKRGALILSLPAGLGMQTITAFLDANARRILSLKPPGQTSDTASDAVHMPGGELILPDGDIIATLADTRILPGRVSITKASGEDTARFTIRASSATDFTSPEWSATYVRSLRSILRTISGRLLSTAAGVSVRSALAPARWDIMWGLSTLGKCSSSGLISLSAALLLYPLPLREYVICHELAHLAHHNHSPRFHTEAERLCRLNFSGQDLNPWSIVLTVDGSWEKILSASLRHHRRHLPAILS